MTIEQALARQGYYVATTSGVSMAPLLRDRRDTVVIRPPSGRLRKYDVALYRRGDRIFLHRVVRVTPTGYVICGDNCIAREYDIDDARIVGVLTELYRGDKKINLNGFGYRAYVRAWCFLYPLRRPLMMLRARLRRSRKG